MRRTHRAFPEKMADALEEAYSGGGVVPIHLSLTAS
jgi:hypothetical protein